MPASLAPSSPPTPLYSPWVCPVSPQNTSHTSVCVLASLAQWGMGWGSDLGWPAPWTFSLAPCLGTWTSGGSGICDHGTCICVLHGSLKVTAVCVLTGLKANYLKWSFWRSSI